MVVSRLPGVTRYLRFAVGSPQVLYSSAWTVWTWRNDLYAAAVQARGAFKLSVHESGVTRLALPQPTPELAALKLDQDPRVLDRWRIDRVGAAELTHCLNIAVPSMYVPGRWTADAWPRSRVAKVTWLTQAPMLRQRVVSLMRTPPTGTVLADPGEEILARLRSTRETSCGPSRGSPT